MFDYKYDWILDFVNIRNEEFHKEFVKMMCVVPIKVVEKLRCRKNYRFSGQDYELFLNDDEEFKLVVNKTNEKYMLKIKNLTEKKFNALVAKEETMSLLYLQSYACDTGKKNEFYAKMSVDDKENIYVDCIQRENGKITKRDSYPIDYYGIIQNVESVESKKKKR